MMGFGTGDPGAGAAVFGPIYILTSSMVVQVVLVLTTSWWMNGM